MESSGRSNDVGPRYEFYPQSRAGGSMKLLAHFRSLATKFLRRSQVDGEMEEELRSHIQHRADDLERSGLDQDAAERQARVEFGGYIRFREECHEQLGGNFLEVLIHDVRFS